MRSIREVLAESHVAAVAIAVLVLWGLSAVVVGVWPFVRHAALFVATAIATHEKPYVDPGWLTPFDKLMLLKQSTFFFTALVSFAAASMLSCWIYGAGPLRSLGRYWEISARRPHLG